MTRALEFIVYGISVTKGSGFAVPNKNAGMKPIWKPDNPKTKDWQRTIGIAASMQLHRDEMPRRPFAEGPVLLRAAFYLPRPQRLRTRTKAALPFPHVTKPDLDKLLRAAKDALTGIVWTDDSQVVCVRAEKLYCAAGESPRAWIHVSPFENEGVAHGTEEETQARRV